MSALHEKIMGELAAEVAGRPGWGEPPGVYFLQLGAGVPSLRRLPVPDGYWLDVEPPEVLARMALSTAAGRSMLARLARPGLHGAAFLCEGFGVETGPGATAGDLDRVEADIRAGAVRRGAATGVEVRAMLAVDRGGVTYSVVLRRGTGQLRRRVVYPKPGAADQVAGSVPDSLDLILASLLGVELPARPPADAAWSRLRNRARGQA